MPTQHIRTVYDQFKAVGVRFGLCPVCQRKGRRQKTFTETNSPFNRNEDGTVKTDREIYQSVRATAKAWEDEKEFVHPRCE